jgi:putative transposase
MSDKFQDMYRIPSSRADWWNYGWNAAYFVTICTQNRECCFGDAIDGKIKLSDIGKIAEQEWLKTQAIRPDMNIKLDEFVVMPNHFHGIIRIGENQYNKRNAVLNEVNNDVETPCIRETQSNKETRSNTETRSIASLQKTNPNVQSETNNNFAPQSKNMASIIRGFKSAVTKQARLIHAEFAWQSRYYDHIIRNEESFQHISEYNRNNPKNWQTDQFYQ